jgi:hypothetical protein
VSRPQGCASPLHSDEPVAGEARDEALSRHLATCGRCAALVAEAQAARDAFRASAPPLRADPGGAGARARRRRPAWRVAAALGACAAAAALALVVLRPPVLRDEGPRTKGTPKAAVFVRSTGGAVRAVVSGDTVRAGEAVQFELEAPGTDGLYVAVLGRDGTGRASVLLPDGGEAVPLARAPKASFVVDAAPGPESFHVLFCARPVALAPVRAALARDGALSPPAGCRVQRVSLNKPDPAGPAR